MIDLLLTITIIFLILNPPFLTEYYLFDLENFCKENLVDKTYHSKED